MHTTQKYLKKYYALCHEKEKMNCREIQLLIHPKENILAYTFKENQVL